MNSTRFAVAGATGRLGRHVVDVLTERGHQVVPIARAAGVDLVTGEGLAAALHGVEIVIDAASWHASEQDAATGYFRAATRNLHRAGTAAGVRLITVASVIGIDKATVGFGVAKQVHEAEHLAGPIPVRILRAAQFHEFIGQVLDWRDGEIARVPSWPSRPVAARAAAEALADLATAAHAPTPIPEIAGPRVENLAELAALLGARRGIDVLAVDVPEDPAVPEGGMLLPGAHASFAGPTFAEWLETH